MNKTIEIAKAGLNRFFDEGYTCWPEEKLRTIFLGRDLESPEVSSALNKWHEHGWIELPRMKEEYLKVLDIIPD